MDTKKKIKVLIVDDSLVFREVLSRTISSDPQLEVVALATDPFDARDKILQYNPDVMTCDVEMPKMNGIEFIRRLLPQYPLPVIVVSSVNNIVFDALNAGAVDFVAKPEAKSRANMEKFLNELVEKIKTAANAKVNIPKPLAQKNIAGGDNFDSKKIIAMGASTGGTEALFSVLKAIPPHAPGIVIVQHIPPVFSRMYAERINCELPLNVKEAASGDMVEQGKVLIAPGDQHMTIRKIGEKYRVYVSPGEKVNGHCPSVDVLFDSVAKEAKNNAIGIILTGMGNDGAKGLLAMRRAGARTIGQDEHSAVVYGMPKVAYEIGAVEKQTSLDKIPQVLFSFLK